MAALVRRQPGRNRAQPQPDPSGSGPARTVSQPDVHRRGPSREFWIMTARPQVEIAGESGRPRITITTAPRREPPFDDELPARHLRLIGSREPQLPFDGLA